MKLNTNVLLPWRIFVVILSLTFFIFFMEPQSYAQEINMDKKVQISASILSIDQLLNELHENYSINFSYNDKKLPLEQIIKFQKTTLSLNEILAKLHEEAQIENKKYSGLIILTPLKPNAFYTISGYIEDSLSGEKLIGASVYNLFNHFGATSNTYGFFSVTFAEGAIKLVVSYVGYKSYEQNITLHADTTIHIRLSPNLEIGEVKIEATKSENITRSQLSLIKVSNKEINKIPALLGETDVLKSLQLLPGVQAGFEGSSSLIVRGGGSDQNLIILDGVPVYNVNHLLGFVSVFNSSAIKEVSLYKSGFPARYGGRASSVIDINMKEGNNKEFKGEGSVGLISSKFTLKGP